MRNSEAQRYARWSAAVAAVLALVVASVYLRNVWVARQAEKKAPPAVPPTVEQRSNEFSFSKVEGQRTIYTVHASRTTEFKAGSRNLLEDVSIMVYGQKGERNDKLTTKACEFISDAGKISCAGEVLISLQADRASTASTIQVETSDLSFDQHTGQALTGKPVTFRWPAGDGHAIGVRYDSNSGTLYLERNVVMTMSVSSPGLPRETKTEPEQALHLTGVSMVFHRESRTVQVQGEVHAQQTTHDLFADNLLLDLDTSFHARHLVASGHPRLRDADVQGPIALDADKISAALRADGSVDSVVATGNVHGSRGTSASEDNIDAANVQMNLSTRQNQPRLLTASRGVVLTSRPLTSAGATRRVETDALEMHFTDDSKGNPRGASGPGPVRVERVNTLAPARVEWQNVSVAGGKPVRQTMRMNGKRMSLSFDPRNQLQQLDSSGGVEVTRQLGDGPEQTTASRELTAKFDGAGQWSVIDQIGDVRFHDGQRSGQGQRAHLDRATNAATLTGSVVLTDANTRTTAQSAVFAQNSSQLQADGNVLTTELRGGTGGLTNFSQEPALLSANHLVADAARGHAIYSGNGRLWQGQSVMEADTIDLDNPSQVLVARGNVRGVFPQAPWSPKPGQTAIRTTDRKPSQTGRPEASLSQVRGGLLTYWDKESRARVEQKAKVDSPQGMIQAEQIDLYFSTPSAVNATKELSRAVATGDVTVRQEDRRGTSNRAEYTASEGKFVLSEGKPTLYDSTGDTTTGRQLTFYFADDRIVVDSEEGTKTVTLHRVEK
jgi:lipopolysaccharide export system protein LptA